MKSINSSIGPQCEGIQVQPSIKNNLERLGHILNRIDNLSERLISMSNRVVGPRPCNPNDGAKTVCEPHSINDLLNNLCNYAESINDELLGTIETLESAL